MNLPRRQFLHLATAAAALPAVSQMARHKPIRQPVRIVVGFAAGGNNDLVARQSACSSTATPAKQDCCCD
jgi:tripartite-type tricarboxylate transporter receptor subunit TctC